MDLAALRVDPEVARRLGVDGLQAIAHRLEPDGDCVVCHRTLGKGPITLSLHWAGQPQNLALVAPAHAPCQPSGYVAGRPPALTPSHRTLALLSPNAGPIVLINHDVDVMLGSIVDGRWVDHFHLPTPDGRDLAAVDALSRIDTTRERQLPPASPHWGAKLTKHGDLTLLSPSSQYKINAEPHVLDAIRRAGRLLVLVSDDVRISTIVETQSVEPLLQAIADHQVHGAWAVVDATPTDVAFPPRAPAAVPAPKGAQSVTSMAELETVHSDRAVEARAVFSDHPAVRLTTGEDRLPVLLLEPHRMVLHTQPGTPDTAVDVNVKTAIDQGLTRMPPIHTADIESLDPARDWTLRVTKHLGRVRLQLVAPFDQVAAEASVKYSSRWHEAVIERGHVLIIYGPMVGVRAPKGRPYTDDDRYHELLTHQHRGLVAWGFVAWHDPRQN